MTALLCLYGNAHHGLQLPWCLKAWGQRCDLIPWFYHEWDKNRSPMAAELHGFLLVTLFCSCVGTSAGCQASFLLLYRMFKIVMGSVSKNNTLFKKD